VASGEFTKVEGTVLWMVDTAPFDGGQPMSLQAGIHASSAPILVSIENGITLLTEGTVVAFHDKI
jgi:hypothetical protein